MPNAKDTNRVAVPRFLVLGTTGTGKTSGFLTLPGKKFMYCFDPNAIETLRGFDVDYEEFLPDDLSLKLTSLSKDRMAKLSPGTRAKADAGAALYQEWEADFEKRLADGFFKNYDAIGLDSFTTLSDMVMDGILALNGRPGQWPNQDDYGPQMLALTNICRTLTGLGKIIYVTGHIEMKQDETTGKILNQPIMTGRLRSKLPLLFSEVLVTSAETDVKKNTNYLVQTRPDRYNQSVRSTLKNSEFLSDITIDWSKPLEGQGLDGLYRLQPTSK